MTGVRDLVSCKKVKTALKKAVQALEDNRDYLNELDGPIGDGDHGESVTSAFRRALNEVEKVEQQDVGDVLRTFGRALALSGGAAMGPLYGTAFLDAGKALAGRKGLSINDLGTLFEAFEEGIVRRGNAKPGEKTMLDTIHPAVEALKEAVAQEKNLDDKALEAVVSCTVEAARAGMESTKNMISERGRSSRLGERSVGHIDPGAASSYLFVKAFLEGLRDLSGQQPEGLGEPRYRGMKHHMTSGCRRPGWLP